MVKIKTVFGTFDTTTKRLIEEPKAKSTSNPFSSFKLATAPPRIIPVSRFGGQLFSRVKRAGMEFRDFTIRSRK